MEEKGSSLFEGLLLGGIIGAALGVMFAPAAGEELRGRVKEKLKDLDLDDVIDRFAEAFDEGKKEAERVMKEEAK
jgi:gas vesicle protein